MFYVCVCVCESLSVVSDSLCNPLTVDCQAPLSMEFFRQEVGSCSLLLGIFPSQGSNPGLPHYRQILYHLSHVGSPYLVFYHQGMWYFSSLTRDRTYNPCIGSRESLLKIYLFRMGWVLLAAYRIFTAACGLLSCRDLVP